MSFFLLNNLLPALTWTLLHSLWQGLLLTVLAGLVLLLTRRSTAALRYALLCTLFFLFLCGVSFTFLLEWNAGVPVSAGIGTPVQSTHPLFHALSVAKWAERATYFLHANAQWIVLSWLAVFLFNAVRMLGEMGQIRTLRRQRTLSPGFHWTTTVQTLCRVLAIRKTVSLLESALVKVPVVIGHFKPIILVPIGLLNHLPPGEIEAILLHELAHIRRHDYLVNFIQRFAEAIFFFNPGLLWVSSLLRVEREACCDEMAIAHTGNKLQFVEALLGCKEHSLGAPAYALGLLGKRNVLHQRLDRIVTNRNKSLSPFEVIFFAVSLLVLTMVLSGWGLGKASVTSPAAVHAAIKERSFSPLTTVTPDEQRQDKKQETRVLVQDLHDNKTNSQSTLSPNQDVSLTHQPALDPEKKPESLENVSILNDQRGPDREEINEIRDYQALVKEMSSQREQDRLQAEKDRAQAQEDREQAARERTHAERDRQQAEKDREQVRKHHRQVAEDWRRIHLQ